MSIKAGIIGCGSITRYRHAPEYKANPHVRDIVFYDRNPERAEALAELFGGTTADSVDALLNDPDIDVISDCSSNEYHHIHTTDALLHGKHVLCEKPMALTIDQADKILAAQEQSGRTLMVDHNQRLTKAHQEVKKIIGNGELGKPLTFKTTFGHQGPEHWGFNNTNSTWFFKKERSGLGVAGDLGIHKIDLIHYLLDDEVAYVNAFQGALDKVDEHGQPIDVADNIVCTLKTQKGALGTGSFSWTYYGDEDNSTVIYCEHGIIKIYTHPEHQIEIIRADGGRVHYQLETIQTNDNQTNTGVIDAFIDAVKLDQTPVVSGHDALSSLKVILGILEAAETGQTVRI